MTNPKPIINHLGRPFPPPHRAIGVVFIVLGLWIFTLNWIVAFCVIALGCLVTLPTNGVEIDVEHRRYKEYTGLITLRLGSWKKLDNWTDVSVIRANETLKVYSHNLQSTRHTEQVYKVILLTANHRKRMDVKKCPNKEDAIDHAHEYARLFGMNYTDYNPQISAASRARRRR